MTEALWSALIVGGLAMTGQFVMAWQAARTRRKELEAANKRQDEVAALAAKVAIDAAADSKAAVADTAKVASLLTARQDVTEEHELEAARLLKLNNAEVARVAAETRGKLDQIHTLVNSNLTAMIERARASELRALKAMREVAAVHAAAGRPPSEAAEKAMDDAETTIAELSVTLRDREVQTRLADKSAAGG